VWHSIAVIAIRFQPYLARWALFGLLGIAAAAAVVSGVRSYYSFLLLRSAYEVGVPNASNIRPWMTLRYVAQFHDVSQAGLVTSLELPPQTHPDASLRSLAQRENQSPFEYVQRVQRAVAEAAPGGAPAPAKEASGWLGALGDQFLAALLAYGYPVLAFTLLLGAIGLPLPTGLSAAVAGSLISQGSMSWAATAAVAVTASVAGDLASYGLGHALSERFLERHGRWLGYTRARRDRARRVFDRWGAVGVLLSRTFASHLSAVLNLFAGASRYRLDAFVAFTILGRLMWTAAYLALGYAVGTDLEAAAAFLTNLSLFLISLAVLTALALLAYARPDEPR
jgi:membrane protein DedA with SNARE-associated domain